MAKTKRMVECQEDGTLYDEIAQIAGSGSDG